MSAFDNYLAQRRLARQQEFEMQMAANQAMQNAAQSVSKGLETIGAAVLQDKQLRGQYQMLAKETGVWKPEQYNVETDAEKTISRLKEQTLGRKAKAQVLLDEQVKKLTTYPDVYKDGKANSVYQRIAELKKLNETYDNELRSLDNQLQEHVSSPDYQTEKENASFKEFILKNPLYSANYYKSMAGKGNDDLKEYEAKLRIKQKYDSGSDAQPRSKESVLDNFSQREKQIKEALNDPLLENPERYNNMLNIIQEARDKITRTNDVPTIDRMRAEYENKLMKLEMEKPKEVTAKDIEDSLFPKYKKMNGEIEHSRLKKDPQFKELSPAIQAEVIAEARRYNQVVIQQNRLKSKTQKAQEKNQGGDLEAMRELGLSEEEIKAAKGK